MVIRICGIGILVNFLLTFADKEYRSVCIHVLLCALRVVSICESKWYLKKLYILSKSSNQQVIYFLCQVVFCTIKYHLTELRMWVYVLV